MQAIRHGTMLPSLSQNKIGTSELDPFPGKSPEACLAALDGVMRSIGDTCPDCS
jgi:hypothetical protein